MQSTITIVIHFILLYKIISANNQYCARDDGYPNIIGSSIETIHLTNLNENVTLLCESSIRQPSCYNGTSCEYKVEWKLGDSFSFAHNDPFIFDCKHNEKNRTFVDNNNNIFQAGINLTNIWTRGKIHNVTENLLSVNYTCFIQGLYRQSSKIFTLKVIKTDEFDWSPWLLLAVIVIGSLIFIVIVFHLLRNPCLFILRSFIKRKMKYQSSLNMIIYPQDWHYQDSLFHSINSNGYELLSPARMGADLDEQETLFDKANVILLIFSLHEDDKKKLLQITNQLFDRGPETKNHVLIIFDTMDFSHQQNNTIFTYKHFLQILKEIYPDIYDTLPNYIKLYSSSSSSSSPAYQRPNNVHICPLCYTKHTQSFVKFWLKIILNSF